MNRIAPQVGCIVLLTMVGTVDAAPPTDAEIRAAIKQLGDEQFKVREKAMKLLREAGPAAEAQLQEALSNPDPEVVKRVRSLIDRIVYRVEPDTPAEIVAMMEKYREGTADEQLAILNNLLKHGKKSQPYFLRLLDAVEPKRLEDLLEKFALDEWRVLVPLMADGQEKMVEQILERAVAARIESVAPHYAVFHFLSGRTDEKIAKLRENVTATGGEFSARLLAALCRLKGDWPGVEWAAERAKYSDLTKLALMVQGKWLEVLVRYPPNPAGGLPQINALGLTAACHRLAGNKNEFEKTLKQIAEYPAGPNRSNQLSYAAKALLINERTQDAIDLLVKSEHFQQAAELLAAQGKVKDALALSERAARAETQPNYFARMIHINLLHRLGEVEKAREWLDRLAKDMAQVTTGTWAERQIELEYKLGLVEAAERRLLDLVEKHGSNYLGHAFEAVFPRLGERADTLWRLLRYQSPKERTDDALKRLRKIDDRTISPDDLADLLKAAAPTGGWMISNPSRNPFDHLAWVVAWFDRADLAENFLSNPNWKEAPPSALLHLADTLAAAGKWQAAADAYRKIWEADRSSVLPYFLNGWALTQAGKEVDGKQMMATAQRMPVGGDSARYYFHEALMDRGFVAAARREVPIRARISPPGGMSFYHGESQAHAARLAHQTGDFLTAAEIYERNLLRLLPTTSGYRSSGHYMRMTGLIHALRAKGLLAQGKKTEAFREIDLALQMHPTHLEVAILLVADLEKAGEKERAGKLFDQVYSALAENCRDFPNYADAHNQIAWLSARCRRRLDEAATHSQKAVELAPLTAPYLDTLAEVQFQRGGTAKAVELMKKCLKMPSANVGFYRQQLARFEKGDPKVEPADE